MNKLLTGSILVLCVLCITGYLLVTDHEKAGVDGRADLSLEKQTAEGHRDIPRDALAPDTPKIAEKKIVEQNAFMEETPAVSNSNEEKNKWIEAAKAAIDNPELNAKYAALWSLGKHSVPESLEILTQFLMDENFDIVTEAIDQIGSIGIQNKELRDRIYTLLTEKSMDHNFPARGAALVTASLIENNDRILPVISKFIQENDYGGDQDVYAARALSFAISPKSIPLLLQLLEKTDNPEVKDNALTTLAKIPTSEALKSLESYLNSPDDKERALTARVLSTRNIKQYNQVIEKAIANKNLGKLAMSTIAKSPAAAEISGDVLQRNDIPKEKKIEWLQFLEKNAIAAKSEVQSGIISAITPLLESNDPDLEIASIKTVGAMGLKDSAVLIESKFSSLNTTVRVEALKAYPVHPDTYKPMLEMVWDTNKEISRFALARCEFLLNESDRHLLEDVASRHDDELMRSNAQKIIDNYLIRPGS